MAVGGFAGLFAVSSAVPLLQSRDQFVAACREQASRLLLVQPQPKPADREAFERLVEREAEVIYARRGAALPLAAMDVILSGLLFFGCARVLRREPWGLAAFELAAAVSIPYQLLDAAFGVVKARDLAQVLTASEAPFTEGLTHEVVPLIVLKSCLAILYFGACTLYVRRPSIRALFPSEAER
jgi:hypothetical protein